MRSPSFITVRACGAVLLVLAATAIWSGVPAQGRALRIAVIAPDGTEAASSFAGALSASLASSATVLDEDLVAAAYAAAGITSPFNMTTAESGRLGSAIGCDYFVIVRAADQRRSASGREEYYESYAVLFAVSTRTGRLADWIRPQFESDSRTEAQRMLRASVPKFAASLITRLREAEGAELAELKPASIEVLPPEGSPLAKGLKAPVPYRRIKPVYTPLAFLYEVAATVEIEMDLDTAGNITRTEIVRWAGFGLDQSVEAAVKAMNWRPAERDGKPLPMRVLLRYNFKKTDK